MTTWPRCLWGIACLVCLTRAASGADSQIVHRGPVDVTPTARTRIADFAFSDDGRLIAVVHSAVPDERNDYAVAVLDRETHAYREVAGGWTGPVVRYGISWSPDGSRLLIDGTGTTRIVDMLSGDVESIDHHGNGAPRRRWIPARSHTTQPVSVNVLETLHLRRLGSVVSTSGDGFVLDARYYVYTPDGRRPRHSLWYIDHSGAFMTLVMPKPDFSWIKLSPDRCFAVIGNHDDSIYLVRGDGTDLTPVIENARGVGASLKAANVQWSRSSDAFLFRTETTASTNQLGLVEIEHIGRDGDASPE